MIEAGLLWGRAPMPTVVELIHHMVYLVIAGYSYLRKKGGEGLWSSHYLATHYLTPIYIILGIAGSREAIIKLELCSKINPYCYIVVKKT